MKIYYTSEFKNVLADPGRYVSLGKCKLGSYSSPVKNYSDLDWTYMSQLDNGRSPTDGYYELGTILRDNLLEICLEIPAYDVGMLTETYYHVIYVVYTDESSGSDGLAFVLFSDSLRSDTDGTIQVMPLRLGRNRNIIRLNLPDHQCTIKTGGTQDTDFLEGSGLGEVVSLEGNKDSGYVSRKDYDTYRMEKLSQDPYDHYETQWINKFGIKIY